MTTRKNNKKRLAVGSLALALGCNSGSALDSSFATPSGDPDYCAQEACAERTVQAMNDLRDFSQPDFIRWPCADVGGVTGPDLDDEFGRDDRGQEYCEYFAVLNHPSYAGDEPQVFGRTTDTQNGHPFAYAGEVPAGVGADETVGHCVFTSWHTDNRALPRNEMFQVKAIENAEDKTPSERAALARTVPAELAELGVGYEVVECDSASGLCDRPTLFGIPLIHDNFKMFGPFNNNFAAWALVFDSLTKVKRAVDHIRTLELEAADHPYWAGCMGTAGMPGFGGSGVEWRVSDPTIGAMISTMADCGCGVDLDGDGALGAADLVPSGPDDQETIMKIAGLVIPYNEGARHQRDLEALDFNGADGKSLLFNDPQSQSFLRGFRLGTWDNPEGLKDGSGCQYVDYDEVNDPSNDIPATMFQPAQKIYDPELGEFKGTQTLVVCPIKQSDLPAGSLADTDLKDLCRDNFGDDVVVHIPIPSSAIVCEPATETRTQRGDDGFGSREVAPQGIGHCFAGGDASTPAATPWDFDELPTQFALDAKEDCDPANDEQGEITGEGRDGEFFAAGPRGGEGAPIGARDAEGEILDCEAEENAEREECTGTGGRGGASSTEGEGSDDSDGRPQPE